MSDIDESIRNASRPLLDGAGLRSLAENGSFTPLEGGSDRRFTRIRGGVSSVVLLSQAPGWEIDSYIDVGRFLFDCGVPVPEILACDHERGLVLMEDVGDLHLDDPGGLLDHQDLLIPGQLLQDEGPVQGVRLEHLVEGQRVPKPPGLDDLPDMGRGHPGGHHGPHACGLRVEAPGGRRRVRRQGGELLLQLPVEAQAELGLEMLAKEPVQRRVVRGDRGSLLVATPVAAQTTSASVFGQVTDSQGGVLPGATATLTSKTQANTLTATTDAEGRFRAGGLPPGVLLGAGASAAADQRDSS